MSAWPFRRSSRSTTMKGRRAAPGDGDQARQQVRVAAVRPSSRRSVELLLEPLGEHSPLTPSAGSHVDVHLPNNMVRQYSLIQVQDEQRDYRICVQLDSNSRGGSRTIHEQVNVGDVLTISPPRSNFSLLEDAKHALLLAGGVGITPLISMAHQLHRERVPFELHVYAKDETDLPLRDHLHTCDFRMSVFTHYSGDGDSFRFQSPRALASPPSSSALYVCGPTGFVETARERAAEHGWAPDSVIVERFTSAHRTETPGQSTEQAFTVVAASTGQRLDVPPEESIADVLERHGYDTGRSCGQGYCGSCLTRVVSGKPDHRDDFQSADEQATNSHINICCSRSFTPELTLDI